MRFRLRISRFAALALLTLPLALTSAAPASAQKCNWTDIENTTKNSFVNGWELLKSNNKCVSYFDDYLFWILSGAVGFAEGASSDAVAACAEIKNADGKVTEAIDQIKQYKDKIDEYKGDLDKIKGYLDTLKGFIDSDSGQSPDDKSALDKNYGEFDTKYKSASATYQDYLGGAEDLLSYLRYVACACIVAEASQGPQFTKILGDCIATGMCDAQDWLHDHLWSAFAQCHTGQPPVISNVDCTVDPCAVLDANFQCNINVPAVGSDVWPPGGPDHGYECNGDHCVSKAALQGQSGNYCYCPQAMQQRSWYGFGADGNFDYLKCACPKGTKPAGTSEISKFICLCESTGFPVGPDGVCPKTCACKCPNNQIPASQGFTEPNGTCACSCGCAAGLTQDGDHCNQPACAGAQEVRLSDNSCCVASQVSSCGVCCGAGQKPSADGSCVAASLHGGDTKARWQKYFEKSLKKSFKP